MCMSKIFHVTSFKSLIALDEEIKTKFQPKITQLEVQLKYQQNESEKQNLLLSDKNNEI